MTSSAFDLLRTTTTVKSARVGYEGTVAPEVVAFRQLLAMPDAAEQFERLLRNE